MQVGPVEVEDKQRRLSELEHEGSAGRLLSWVAFHPPHRGFPAVCVGVAAVSVGQLLNSAVVGVAMASAENISDQVRAHCVKQ